MLVYEETTEDSVNSIESLLRKNEVNSSMVCALLDSVSGVDELRRLGSRLPPARSVSHVCSAEIYCDCFTRVRHAIRAGTPTATIQRELDSERSTDFGRAIPIGRLLLFFLWTERGRQSRLARDAK